LPQIEHRFSVRRSDEIGKTFCLNAVITLSLAVPVTSAFVNARAYQEERRRAEALAEIDERRRRFSNVSHEFRTPLTMVLGPLEDELGEQTDPLPAADANGWRRPTATRCGCCASSTRSWISRASRRGEFVPK
jgi:signal transduction histidine kinase